VTTESHRGKVLICVASSRSDGSTMPKHSKRNQELSTLESLEVCHMGVREDIVKIRTERNMRKAASLDFGLKLMKLLKGQIEGWADAELSDLEKEIELLRAEVGNTREMLGILAERGRHVEHLLKYSSKVSSEVQSLISKVENGEIDKATESIAPEIVRNVIAVFMFIASVQLEIDQITTLEAMTLRPQQ